MTSPLLSMNDVAASYGDFQALFNVTLTVDLGEVVTLIGSNGAGKTTTLRAWKSYFRRP
jgi:branched-chain amino acid transport system ATP-binding protein